VQELEQLSTGRDPNTGAPFGNDIEAIFNTFLRRNIPVDGEALFTLVDGRPHRATASPVDLFADRAVMAQWAAVTDVTQAEIDTSEGRVRYLAVPVLAEDSRRGVFVVAIFLRGERQEIDQVVQTGGIVYGSIFMVASVVVWFAAGRVLRPVRLLTEAARSIEDDNWSQRIPVNGDDEIAQLAATFNDMVDRLETAFVTQRRFIDDAGHELRTPITIIRGHLELEGDDPSERAEVKRLVMGELDRMSRMVEDLLLLAKAGHPDFLDAHPIDVGDFTEEIAVKASALSSERQWTLEDSAAVVMVADRQRLTQAMMNLAQNAVEHSEAGSAISIGSHAAGEIVRFWVRDEGVGIAARDRERIFERFARGPGGPRRSDGAGLGLSIVKAIAEGHGGQVELVSAPGRGSIFSLALPMSGPEEASNE
jgi:signal transduction histidine kinase